MGKNLDEYIEKAEIEVSQDSLLTVLGQVPSINAPTHKDLLKLAKAIKADLEAGE